MFSPLFIFQSLCCIEKKGILSWPNPTAEKVFFLTNKSSQNKRTRLPSSTREDSSESEDESNDVKRNSYIKAEVADIGMHYNTYCLLCRKDCH